MKREVITQGRERLNQKARTRSDLLAAARRLIQDGRRPTIEEAALAAGISKRTAYRYFTSQQHLLADAALEALRPRMDEMLSSVAASEDVHERIAVLASALCRLAEDHDADLREMIRASLDRGIRQPSSDLPRQRGGRRLDWIRTSLAPVQGKLSASDLQMLTESLAVCLGVDALMVLRDICGASAQRSEAIMIWMANACLDRMLNHKREKTE